VLRRDDGRIAVAWQIGRSTASVAVRLFGGQFGAATDEVVLSSADESRATHPQLFGRGDDTWMLWTHDPTRAMRVRGVDAEGSPTGPARTMVADGAEFGGFYPDAAVGPDGPLVVWYGGHEKAPRPGYGFSTTLSGEGGHKHLLGEKMKRGGPPTVAFGADGTGWVVGSQVEPLTAWGISRIAMWRVAGDALVEPRLLGEAKERWERPTLAFGDAGSGIVGWTRYAMFRQPWGAFVRMLDADGRPVGPERALGRGPGRMVDVAAERDVAVVAWEEPYADDDIVFEVVDLATGDVRCGPTRAHVLTTGHQTRASVDLWEEDGEVHGVLVWQSGASRTSDHEVWGRRFALE
jgi:hypothetical protein